MKHYFELEKKYEFPDKNGKFGIEPNNFGGKFVPETLIPALDELEKAFLTAWGDEAFLNELYSLLKDYAGRETPLYYAKRLSDYYGKGKIYLKREDLNHTGAHKINNVIAQAMLAKRMGKKRVIAETGAGQHGVATATAAALFDLDCEIFMGAEDIIRQKSNVERMKMLGAKVTPVTAGTQTLKDATSEAIRQWCSEVETTYYLLGSATGPHPYPMLVRNFQSVIGNETKHQILEKENRLPDHVLACVGGGSNAIGIFYSFINDKDVNLIGLEAAGLGVGTDKHCASITKAQTGIFHGAKSFVLQDDYGQIQEAYSISAGLDYPGVGPEHSYLKSIGRVNYQTITDDRAVRAFKLLTKLEGIVPAIESAHALAYLDKIETEPHDIIIVCLSGRGDKDIDRIMRIT